MEGGITVGAMMQIGAWGLGLGTLFFAFFGIRADRVRSRSEPLSTRPHEPPARDDVRVPAFTQR
jgi:hypothetical protein